jgi:hypothetical protein|tara:strand:- start:28 stop:150 length:123 start_codon:yes stop_codon:yes gene_type:complete
MVYITKNSFAGDDEKGDDGDDDNGDDKVDAPSDTETSDSD